MDSDSRAIILVILLFIASAYCALTETALAAVSKNKIKVLSEKGNRQAKRVSFALDNFEDAITTLLICTNVAHIAAASVVTVNVTRIWGLNAVTASTFVTTIAMFFFGEMLPKSIGKKISLEAIMICAGPLVVLMKVLKPLAAILSGIGKFTLKLLKADEEVSVTEDEIYDIIEDMAEEGTLDANQSELISSALSFGDTSVSSILTPRVDLVGVDINMAPEEIFAFTQSQNHSRVVVYDKTVDNIVGVLQIRKYLKTYISSKTLPAVSEVMDEVFYTHQSTLIDELLDSMTKNKLNMAVILDGYGGTLGIVTIEDIVEEIVGEIWDESDVEVESLVEITDNVYVVNADETVEDALENIDFEITDEKDSERFTNLLIADWVCEHFEMIPSTGDSFMYNNLKVTVSKEEHNRILQVILSIVERADTDDTDKEVS